MIDAALKQEKTPLFYVFCKIFIRNQIPPQPVLNKLTAGGAGCLTALELPSLKKKIADYCLKDNLALSKLYAPKVEIIGAIFLKENMMLTELDLPNVRKIGNGVLRENINLAYFNAPKLKKIGDLVMPENLGLTELNLPALQEVGDNFLRKNKKLKIFYAPKLSITKGQLLEKKIQN